MCSLIPEGGRDLGCFVEEGTSSGLLGAGFLSGVAMVRASGVFLLPSVPSLYPRKCICVTRRSLEIR